MKFRITSKFGEIDSVHPNPHTGIDLAMPEGTPLRSIADGVVQKVVDYGTEKLGKGVLVQWEDGKVAIYGHMNKVNVIKGEHVKAGELLGYSGNTGHSTGPHLHFGLYENGQFIDPSPYIDSLQNMNEFVQISATEVAQRSFEILNSKLSNVESISTDIDIIDTFINLTDLISALPL